MIISDFLSRLKHDKSNSHETILISFNMQETLNEKSYNLHEAEQERYIAQTTSQTKISGTVLP